jgi:hypothetical protein
MGRRGPKPAPTALKIAAGVRADRINVDSPAGPVGVPTPPPWLTGEARAEWDRTVAKFRSSSPRELNGKRPQWLVNTQSGIFFEEFFGANRPGLTPQAMWE